MLTEPILKIMIKNGTILSFYYEEQPVEVYDKVLSATNDIYYAGSVAKTFEKNKNAKSKEMLNKMCERTLKNATYPLLSVIAGKNGEKYYIRVGDTPKVIISKFEQAKGRRLNETEKQEILNYYENLIENLLVNNQLDQNSKKARK